ncbi:MAG: NAD(P)-binding protein [Deinococcus-Thermus bacterium]|jgi:predicted NAD/FAD-binding protein|nr:NAD(P)-binding protein [Deinococcota bacterium]
MCATIVVIRRAPPAVAPEVRRTGQHHRGERFLRIAIVGSGIAGLGSSWLLDRHHHVTLYESHPRLGGHSHTVTTRFGEREVPVDTGFIVYNERNYPNLVKLFGALEVPTEASNMSFGVSQAGGALEYASTRWDALFAQRRRLLSPRHWALLADIPRFNRVAARFLASAEPDRPLGDWLDAHGFGRRLAPHYVLPMAAAIWSAPLRTVMNFSARSFLMFFQRHGLLSVNDQPQWRTVSGGSRVYVDRIAKSLRGQIRRATPVGAVHRTEQGVVVTDAMGHQDRFDAVVLAAHADQSRAMLTDADDEERALLGRFPYQGNRAVLHSDPALMPKRRRAWASWNFLTGRATDPDMPVSVTYWMNLLQNIDEATPLFVSLNPLTEPRAELVHAELDYAHPLFDTATIDAQAELDRIQGRGGVWYAGAWCGYGFHEDGLASAVRVCERGFGVRPPWERAGAGNAGVGLPERAAASPA